MGDSIELLGQTRKDHIPAFGSVGEEVFGFRHYKLNARTRLN